MAIVLGQHVRVGNEDNLWGADRKRKTTVEQIEGVVRICKAFGRKVATAEEARKISKVGIWYNSVEETLQNNGMPPNPTEFNPGFLTWPTDGKKVQPVIGGDSHPIAACMVPHSPEGCSTSRRQEITRLPVPLPNRSGTCAKHHSDPRIAATFA